MSSPSNGVLSIQGIQTGIAQGYMNHGPFSIPFSAILDSVVLPADITNQALPIPAAAHGAAIIPNGTSGMTVEYGYVSGQLHYQSPVYPSYDTFDFTTPNVPADLYITISNTSGASVTVLFW